MMETRREKGIGVLFLLGMGVSWGAWWSVSQAILVAGASDWLVPSIFFLVAVPIAILPAVLSEKRWVHVVSGVIVLLPSWYFAQSISMILFFLIAWIWGLHGLGVIASDIRNQKKIRVMQSIRQGTFSFVFAISIMVTGVYTALISDMPSEKLFPKFTFSDGTGRAMLRMMEGVNPKMRAVSEGNMTVDQFLKDFLPKNQPQENGEINRILETLRETGGGVPMQGKELSTQVAAEQQKLFLIEGKKRLSDMLGRTVRGDEPVLDIFTELLNGKIFAFANVENSKSLSPELLRSILALFLFLTLISIGSMLAPLWGWIAGGGYALLRAMGVGKIRKALREVEEIDEIESTQISTQQ